VEEWGRVEKSGEENRKRYSMVGWRVKREREFLEITLKWSKWD
jgi:hypothetical protein